jgi:hypothetical protein
MRCRLSRIVGALAVITLFGMIQGFAATQQIAEDKPSSFSDRELMLLERIEKLERRLAELESRAPSSAIHARTISTFCRFTISDFAQSIRLTIV